jgi:cell division protein FtsQ
MRRLIRLWRDPRLLSQFALAFRLGGLAALLMTAARLGESAFALRHLVVENGGAAVREAQVRTLIRKLPSRSLATLDLDEVRLFFENLPQVRTAEVFRELPNRLRVRVLPQRAFARFDGGGAVNVHGERIAAMNAADALPILRGPRERAAEMAEMLAVAKAALFPLGLGVNQVSLGAGGDWRIFTDGGFVLRLGAANPRSRLARFAALFARAQTLPAIANARYFDLRYPHGMAAGGGGGE